MENGLMMIYKTWAPDNAMWTEWAKPVLFASNAATRILDGDIVMASSINLPLDFQAMLILDLPGDAGVAEALALARCGYRPVPVYNSVDGPNQYSIVKTHEIVRALVHGSRVLEGLSLRHDAPPAFMLDSNRMPRGYKHQGTYDNRWCVFSQDMPSAAYLQRQGIRRVIIRSDTIRQDLTAVVHRYKKAGLEIILWDTQDNAMKTAKLNSGWTMQFFNRFSVVAGLTRNTIGGFGDMVPEPIGESGVYHGGYHGFG